MSTAEKLPFFHTVEDFLAWEETQPERYEFFDGVVRMMVGARGVHNTLAVNLRNALHRRRPEGCHVYVENFKLATAKGLFYPDVLVTCDADAPQKTSTSDILLAAEVLSPSSVRDDVVRKKMVYLGLPGLRHYLIVSQEVVQVEVWTRRDTAPATADLYTRLDQSIDLPGLDCRIPLAEIYQDTDVPQDVGGDVGGDIGAA